MSASLVQARTIGSADRLLLSGVWATLLGTIGALINAGQSASIPLLLVAIGLGAVFLHTRFGFSGAFRAFLDRQDGAELSAGLLIAAIVALVIIPLSATTRGTDPPPERPHPPNEGSIGSAGHCIAWTSSKISSCIFL